MEFTQQESSLSPIRILQMANQLLLKRRIIYNKSLKDDGPNMRNRLKTKTYTWVKNRTNESVIYMVLTKCVFAPDVESFLTYLKQWFQLFNCYIYNVINISQSIYLKISVVLFENVY